jgi:regulator of replication initiation timing
MEEIHNKIKHIEENINLEYREIQDLKKEIIKEQKITLKLYELSLVNGSFDLENEIKKIYIKIYDLDLEDK